MCRSIVGPMIGGALARPCVSYPDIFPRGTIWDRYPYLLPNLFSAFTVLVGVVVGIFFLDETHLLKKHRRDRGREIGDFITSKLPSLSVFSCSTRSPEKERLLGEGCRTGADASDEEYLPEYRSEGSSPQLAAQPDPELAGAVPPEADEPSRQRIFTKPVIMNIISYGILAL